MIGFFYDLLFIMPLALASSLIAKPYFADGTSASAYTIVTVLVSLLFLFMKHFKLRERLITLGFTATLIAALIFVREEGTRMDYLIENIWALKVAALTLFIALIFMIMRRHRIMRFIPAIIALLSLPLSFVLKFTLDKAAVIFLFMFALITLADEIGQRRSREGDDSKSKHLVFISPFILAIFIIAAFIPVSSKPYGWGFVKNMYEGTLRGISSVNRFFSDNGWDSGSPFIGFSDNGRFGGNLNGGGYTVLDLTSSTGNDKYLYLAGRTYDTFDGRQWSGEDAQPVYFDAVETASAGIDCTGRQVPEYNDALLDYIRPVTLEINKNSTGSERTFAPSKIIPTSGPTSGFDSGADKVSYLRTNTSVDAFSDMLNRGHTVTAQSWDTARELLGLSANEAYDFSRYEDYRSQIRKQYTPDTPVSDEVRKFTDGIIGDAGSDYEKLTRIEEMLHKGHYTEKPGDLPELSSAADYLDYFLFEKREGYCSYYATAFVLLARSYGIPARLVQGYRVPAGDKMHIKVLSTDAHAWAEAYMDGVGWITFEPTPGMKSAEQSSGWMTAEEAAEYYRSHYATQTGGTDESLPDGTDDKMAEESSFSLLRIVVPVLCGLLFTAILLIVDAILKRKRYMRSSDREKVLWLCQRSMHVLEKRGRGRGMSETLSEYRERLQSIPAPEDLGFLDIYENLLYSTTEIGQEEVRILEGSYPH